MEVAGFIAALCLLAMGMIFGAFVAWCLLSFRR